MENRRQFMGQVIGGTAALAAGAFLPARRVLGANDRVRFALIGAGGRGTADLRAALKCPNVEAVAVADVYTRRLEQVKRWIPNAKQYADFRRLLDDKNIDAVIIATPQHQHALNFVPALEAGKDVYQEKTMAFNPNHARRMKRAFLGSNRVVQVGIQSTSSTVQQKAHEMTSPDEMGVITALHTHMYRNAAYGGWGRALPADCNLQNVDWKMFQGEAAPHPFDPNRVINWRFFWDYSGGNVFENMVHQVGFWYKALGLGIPSLVQMTGANYISPNMEVPDTMNVSMEQPEKLLFTWNSGFGNRFYTADDDLLLGRKGTLIRHNESIRYLSQSERHHEPVDEPAAAAGGVQSQNIHPDIVSGGDETVTHMQNFFDCVRSRKETNCPFDLGYKSAIACQMALAALHQKRAVRWDTEREEIVAV
ncbi:MAG TPA: Gfo/Idh/MocA family oxidoreductase [Terriglobia bacterium]|nr:Gfo/Idh/MocA family oxidoreductase [Terriglobia bacterium]